MTQRDPERFQDAVTMFTLSVLSNDGFEGYIVTRMMLGHEDNMKEDELRAYAAALNDLRENNFEIYKRLYAKLFALILEDNLHSEGSPYNIFDRARMFGDYIKRIMSGEGSPEEICAMYEEKEQLDTKLK